MLLPGGKEVRVLVSVFTIAVMGIGQISLRIIFGGNAHRFRSNWQDYRSAGISGSDILWAFSQPAFKSGAWLTAFALAVAIIFSMPHLDRWIDDGPYWALLSVIVDAGFFLTGGVLLDTAMWSKASGMGPRFVSAATLLLCSGAILCLAFILVLLSLGLEPDFSEDALIILLPITVVTLLFRIWFVRRAWNRAIQRLDGQLDF